MVSKDLVPNKESWLGLWIIFSLFVFSDGTIAQQRTSVTTPEFKVSDNTPARVYAGRRAKVLSQMDSASVAVFRAADYRMYGGDVSYKYHQENNFYYLTGWTESSSYLVLIPSGFEINGNVTKEILFVQPVRKSATGTSMGVEAAKQIAGCSFVLTNDKFDQYFPKFVQGKKILYYSMLGQTFVSEPLSGKKYFIDRDAKKELTDKYPGLQIKSANVALSGMRQIKSMEELELLQKAINITGDAYQEAAKSAEPGMFEYELQAVIEYVFTREGSEGVGFSCIVGSGPNSCSIHYDANRRKMENGDVVVMDIGAQYHGYTADVTRTIPVNGKFSPQQKEIYEIVLKAQSEVIKIVKAGLPPKSLNDKAQEVVGEGLIKLGLMKDQKEVGKFLPHGISHDIGLDVHDVGGGKELQAGQVVTVEPGIYIPERTEGVDKKYWNIGIRIEDDVLVTSGGCKVLSANAPRTVDEIERLMKKKGIGNMPVGK
jgi:Xaa-Pro aminopeptidase